MDLFHNGGQRKYSFVLMLISLSSLATTSKFQKNICFRMRVEGLININTKVYIYIYIYFSCQERGSRYCPLLNSLKGTSLAVSHWKLRMDTYGWVSI